ESGRGDVGGGPMDQAGRKEGGGRQGMDDLPGRAAATLRSSTEQSFSLSGAGKRNSRKWSYDFMPRLFSRHCSKSVFPRALLCALLLPAPAWIDASARTNRPAAAQEGRQPARDPKSEKLPRSVTIYRDNFGVPHVFGKTDASVVFGLMYAQCEDNFWQLETDLIRSTAPPATIKGDKSLTPDLAYTAF